MFNYYLDKLYNLKSNHTSSAVQQTAKLLVNSFLGKFGLDILLIWYKTNNLTI